MVKISIKPKVYNIDADGQSLGRLASKIAVLLRGKAEVNFEPHIDPRITVRVSNIEKMVITGSKFKKKIYRHHTGWPGGLKSKTYQEMASKNKNKALRLAVLRMLKKNRMRAKLIKRLIVE